MAVGELEEVGLAIGEHRGADHITVRAEDRSHRGQGIGVVSRETFNLRNAIGILKDDQIGDCDRGVELESHHRPGGVRHVIAHIHMVVQRESSRGGQDWIHEVTDPARSGQRVRRRLNLPKPIIPRMARAIHAIFGNREVDDLPTDHVRIERPQIQGQRVQFIHHLVGRGGQDRPHIQHGQAESPRQIVGLPSGSVRQDAARKGPAGRSECHHRKRIAGEERPSGIEHGLNGAIQDGATGELELAKLCRAREAKSQSTTGEVGAAREIYRASVDLQPSRVVKARRIAPPTRRESGAAGARHFPYQTGVIHDELVAAKT